MIPFPEDILTNIIEGKLKVIKSNLDIINRIFPTTSLVNINRLKEFIKKNKIKVTRGFPRDIATLPSYVIMLGGEHEAEEALGSMLGSIGESSFISTSIQGEYQTVQVREDGIYIQVDKKPLYTFVDDNGEKRLSVETIIIGNMEYDENDFEISNSKLGILRLLDIYKDNVKDGDTALINYSHYSKGYELMGTRMNTQYRIEAWATNGDLTVLMYHLLQWMLISERDNLNHYQNDLLLQNIGGADLEPLPDYMPEFVYRRALMCEFSYQITFDNEFPFISNIIATKEDDF